MVFIRDTEARRLVAVSGLPWSVVVVFVWRWAEPVPAWLAVVWVLACGVLWVVGVLSLPEAWRPEP